MKVVYKNPEIKFVELRSLPDGAVFRHPEYTHAYLKLYSEGSAIVCYDMQANHIDKFAYDAKVQHFEKSELVIHTGGKNEN